MPPSDDEIDDLVREALEDEDDQSTESLVREALEEEAPEQDAAEPEPLVPDQQPERAWYDEMKGPAAAALQGATGNWADEFASFASPGAAEYLRQSARDYPYARGAGTAASAVGIAGLTGGMGLLPMLAAEGVGAFGSELGESHDYLRALNAGTFGAAGAGLGSKVPELWKSAKGQAAKWLGILDEWRPPPSTERAYAPYAGDPNAPMQHAPRSTRPPPDMGPTPPAYSPELEAPPVRAAEASEAPPIMSEAPPGYGLDVEAAPMRGSSPNSQPPPSDVPPAEAGYGLDVESVPMRGDSPNSQPPPSSEPGYAPDLEAPLSPPVRPSEPPVAGPPYEPTSAELAQARARYERALYPEYFPSDRPHVPAVSAPWEFEFVPPKGPAPAAPLESPPMQKSTYDVLGLKAPRGAPVQSPTMRRLPSGRLARWTEPPPPSGEGLAPYTPFDEAPSPVPAPTGPVSEAPPPPRTFTDPMPEPLLSSGPAPETIPPEWVREAPPTLPPLPSARGPAPETIPPEWVREAPPTPPPPSMPPAAARSVPPASEYVDPTAAPLPVPPRSAAPPGPDAPYQGTDLYDTPWHKENHPEQYAQGGQGRAGQGARGGFASDLLTALGGRNARVGRALLNQLGDRPQSLWEQVRPRYTPGSTTQAGRDIGAGVGATLGSEAGEVAYADAPAMHYALTETLASGDTGLSPEDQQALTSAVVQGDDQAIAAIDFRLRQRVPGYARRVERALRALNQEE